MGSTPNSDFPVVRAHRAATPALLPTPTHQRGYTRRLYLELATTPAIHHHRDPRRHLSLGKGAAIRIPVVAFSGQKSPVLHTKCSDTQIQRLQPLPRLALRTSLTWSRPLQRKKEPEQRPVVPHNPNCDITSINTNLRHSAHNNGAPRCIGH